VKRSSWSPEEYDVMFKNWHMKSRTEYNEMFLGNLDRSIKILEVGCNVGNQLMLLQKMGFNNLYGVEINEYAVEEAKKRTNDICIMQGSVYNLPYENNEFDLVFTSGVLIHISPKNIFQAMKEIYRCSNKYIWGYENYVENGYEEMRKDYLWKTDFAKLYHNIDENSKIIKKEIFIWTGYNNSFFSFFLLEK